MVPPRLSVWSLSPYPLTYLSTYQDGTSWSPTRLHCRIDRHTSKKADPHRSGQMPSASVYRWCMPFQCRNGSRGMELWVCISAAADTAAAGYCLGLRHGLASEPGQCNAMCWWQWQPPREMVDSSASTSGRAAGGLADGCRLLLGWSSGERRCAIEGSRLVVPDVSAPVLR